VFVADTISLFGHMCLQRIAFRRGEVGFRFADALLLAALSDAWAVVEAELRAGVAAGADEPGSPRPDTDVAAALREFRYEHGLISADDARAWLDTWELSPEEWKAAVARRALRPHDARGAGAHAADDEALARAAWPDLVCSGRLAEMTRRLAEHVAVAGLIPPLGRGEKADPGSPPLLPGWLGIPEPRDHPAVLRLEQLANAHAERRRREVSEAKIREAIASRGLDWTHLETQRLVVDSAPVAAEAALRVREDGDTLAEIAAEIGRPLESWSGFLDTADAAARARLSSAREGDLLGPFPDARGHALLLVRTRRPPDERDPAVRAHAENEIWSAVADRALVALTWEMPLMRTRHE
jgi:hypothetical protein